MRRGPLYERRRAVALVAHNIGGACVERLEELLAELVYHGLAQLQLLVVDTLRVADVGELVKCNRLYLTEFIGASIYLNSMPRFTIHEIYDRLRD